MGDLQCALTAKDVDDAATDEDYFDSTHSTSTASPVGSRLVKCARSTTVTGSFKSMVVERWRGALWVRGAFFGAKGVCEGAFAWRDEGA